MSRYKYKVVNKSEGSCVVDPDSSFYLNYSKGTNVKALKGSLGVMLFQNRRLATAFLDKCQKFTKNKYSIKRVVPLGEPTFPKEVSGRVNQHSLVGFNRRLTQEQCFGAYGSKPPEGTVCYPEVFVVD